VNEQQPSKSRLRLGLAVSQAREPLPWGNSGTGGPPLPRRRDDHAPRTPSAATRREAFARRHPDIPITTCREGTRLVFEVLEPGKREATYHDADAMMDDLEARYP
jgi:hypothetical protein